MVETDESEAALGNLSGSIMILATDNKVTEDSFYKGNSTSEKYFLLKLHKNSRTKNGS